MNPLGIDYLYFIKIECFDFKCASKYKETILENESCFILHLESIQDNARRAFVRI